MSNLIDPDHKQLHRVRLADIVKYKAGTIKTVTAICGKTWAPVFPVTMRASRPRCPICFPTEQYKFATAA